MRPRLFGWLAGLALAALGMTGPALFAQVPPPPRPPGGTTAKSPAPGQGKMLRLSRDVAGDAKPVVVEADHVVTWNEEGRIVLLLEGRVLIQQGVVQCRFTRGAVWADLEGKKSSGVLHVAFYGEGGARVDISSEVQDGARVGADLHTRGELKVRTPRGKIIGQDRSKDPLVTRAREAGIGKRRVVPPPEAPGALPPVPGLKPVGAALPASEDSGVRPAVHVESRPAPAPAVVPVAGPATETSPAPSPRTTLPPIPVIPPPISTLPPVKVPAPAPAPAPLAENPAPVPGPTPTPSPSRQVPVPSPTAPRRIGTLEYRIGPRTGGENWNLESTRLDDGRWLITISNGVVLSVRGLADVDGLEVEADRAVIWTRPGKDGPPTPRPDGQGEPVGDMEFYMAGHVVLRTTRPVTRDKVVIDADELYYDTRRSVAIALQTRLELRPATKNPPPGVSPTGVPQTRINLSEPIVVKAEQLFQTSENTYEVVQSEVFSSKLPSDPGLKLSVMRATLEERRVPRVNILGQPVLDRKTGQPLTATQSILKAENVVGTLEDVPFFYLPYLVTDARDPFGPLENVRLGGNNIFGFETGVTLNMYKLLGMQPFEGTRWKLYPDYMTKRGPSLGTLFSYDGKLADVSPEERMFFPEKVMAGDYTGSIRLFGMYDQSTDNLGNRPANLLTFQPSGFRGRATWQHFTWDLPGGFDLIAGASFLSDRNYLEQYFKREFDADPNQATFVYGKQQCDFWAYSALVQARPNNWITTTEWLPRLDGYLQGVSLFDRVISNTRASVGYARLSVSSDTINPTFPAPPDTPLPPFTQTLQGDSTGRVSIMQDFSLPLDAGPVKLVPYVTGMLAGYTNDLNGDQAGRAWGGLGLRASMPLTRMYEGVESEMFNVNGLNHKMTFGGNYLYARANDPFGRFPQLDLLNDDATNQMLREFTPLQPQFNPKNGLFLATSQLFDPQTYAIRRLVDNRIDTLDNINVLQMEWRQRLQTKRGFPGSQHIVDWMTLDLSASYFPQPSRDNFGKTFSFLEYRYLWNIGDRTALESTGWYDTQDDGPRVYTVGLYLDRPDRTTFYLGYRQIDPLESRLVTGAMTYLFSQKYAMTLAVSYDLGVSQAITNSLVFTRTGRDLSISAGFTYNSLQNNFGVVFEIIPNLLGQGRGYGASSVLGGANGGGVLGR